MFKRLLESEAQLNAHPVALKVDGMEFFCREGDSVAAALFAAGLLDCRDTPVKLTICIAATRINHPLF